MMVEVSVKRKHPEAECEDCPLYKRPMASTQGPRDSKVAFVSRSPGYHEGVSGKPFSGPSGQVLDHLLKMNGVKREEILTTNVVLCAPEEGKVPPEAIKACAPRLHSEIESCNLIIAGGSEAVNLLVGRGSIDRYRGYRIDRSGKTYVATNNPALVLRDASTFPNLIKDFRRAFNPKPQPPFPTVEVIENGRDAASYLSSITQGTKTCSADLETRGGLTHKATIVCLSLATVGNHATVIGEREGLFQDSDFINDHLRPFFEQRQHVCSFIWHNGKFDTKILRHTYGIDARVDDDTMLLSYALDERGGVHSLEYLLAEEYGWPDYEPASVKRFKKSGVVEDYDELYNYAGWDSAGSLQLWTDFEPKAHEDNVYDMYRKLLIPGSGAVTLLELNGMMYDIEGAADLYEDELGPELKQIQESIREELDNPIFSPRSPQQVARQLYDVWGITHEMQKRPDMKRSVDNAARKEILAGRYKTVTEKRGEDATELRKQIDKIVKLLDRSSKLQKQASTYILSLIEQAASDSNGRIHTDLKLHSTVTGRPSSSDPNLLNITRTKEDLPNIRKLFIAAPGYQIVSADYSQAELRCIAAFSGDPQLTEAYTEGLDLHNITAERFFGPDYTPEQRSISKNCNFGMFYLQSAATFQEKHGIPEQTAQKYIDWAHQAFPVVWEWEEEIKKLVHSNQVISPFGRKRRFYLLTKENKQASYREAINFFPQSTAADFTLTALIKMVDEVDLVRAKLCLTVYDAIIAEVIDEYVDEYSAICRQVMESRPKEELGWKIPFKVDIGVGSNWSDAK